MGFSSLSFQKHHIQTHRILRWVLRSTACMKVYGWQRSPSDSASDSLLHTRTRIHWLALHFKNLVKSKSSHASKDCRSQKFKFGIIESWKLTLLFLSFLRMFLLFWMPCRFFFLFFSKMHVAGLGARRNAPLLAWDLVKTWHHSCFARGVWHCLSSLVSHIVSHIISHIVSHIVSHIISHIVSHIV